METMTPRDNSGAPPEKMPPRQLPPPEIWIALPRDDGRVPYMHWMKPEMRETPLGLEYRSLPGGPDDWVPVCWAVPYYSAEELARARAAGMVQGVRAAGYQIMRSMSNQEEAEKARAVCEWLAGRFEAEAARAGGKDGEE